MYEDPATIPASSPDQQLQQLSQLTNQLKDQLLREHLSVPTKILNNLGQISNHLNRLSEQIAQSEERRQGLVAMADIASVVNSTLKIEEVLRIAMDTIVRLTGAERGFLMLVKKSGGMSIRIARNWEQETVEPSEFAISKSVIREVVKNGKPVVTTNAQLDPRFGEQKSIVFHNLRSILCVPLKVRGQITGVIYADNRVKAGIFSEKERDLLATFADQAAVAVENARLFESIQKSLAEMSTMKNLMDNVFSSITSGLVTVDTRNRITLCNPAAEEILGFHEGELIGRQLGEKLPAFTDHLAAPIMIVQQTDQPILGLEITPILPQRGQVDLSISLAPLKASSQRTEGVAIVIDDITETRRLQGQTKLFERMVSPAVISQLNPNSIRLGGKRAEITTLFADVRGFTPFSEELEPEEVVNILNIYLTAAANAILDYGGTIDKFSGDSIMAWFNAPINQEDHALRAVQAGLAIRQSVQDLHGSLPDEFHLEYGVGIHSGDAVLGLIGTEKRWDYTAIGDSVNTAMRIQENAKENQILISTATYNRIKDNVSVLKLNPVQVKGKSQPIQIYEVKELKTNQLI